MSNEASLLFSPYRLRDLELSNRIVVSPMLQNASVEGSPTAWHLMHYGNLAISGPGLMILEATAVEPRGRIGPRCLGLYSDDNEQRIGEILRYCREVSDTRIGVQLAHAGRKGSIAPNSNPRRAMTREEGGWDLVSASVYEDGVHARPEPLDLAGIAAMVEAWVDATRRALRLDFDLIEFHFAHGYLVNQFLSPLINARRDAYGGARENRMRLALEIFAACRAIWPRERPMGVRISAVDWVEEGWQLEDSIVLARELKALGCDYITASSGGVSTRQKITSTGPGYQAPFARAIREQAGIATMAVGSIGTARFAEQLLQEGAADLIALGRPMLYNPRWAWHAAVELGVHLPYHYRYRLCHPEMGEMLNFPETKENSALLTKLGESAREKA